METIRQVEGESAAAVRVTGDEGPVEEPETLILDSLEDDKAEDLTLIDLTEKSSLADVMIIASGRSARHVSSIADHLAQKVKESTGQTPKIEGLPNADWVLIDLGDVIVHLFRPEVRSFYNLEKIWAGDSGHRPSDV